MVRVYVCVHEYLCMFSSWAKWTFDDIKNFPYFRCNNGVMVMLLLYLMNPFTEIY